MDAKRWITSIVIAIIFTFFVIATIQAFMPQPEYGDYCTNNDRYYPRAAVPLTANTTCPSFTDINEDGRTLCQEQRGSIEYTYDGMGCPLSYVCETCSATYEDAVKHYNVFFFLVSAVAGLLAIALGLFLPNKNLKFDWIGMGLLLGGLIVLFVGTGRTYSDLDRLYRPFILFIELILVIYLAYNQFEKMSKPKK
ncbi:MAG: hypothetical protein H6502_05045 [Candidatus Woesearchaeota archaeon]|nr:MAG: hypothetical protein H6502_05045 [Candidatus Woesearchaeota archaeon]